MESAAYRWNESVEMKLCHEKCERGKLKKLGRNVGTRWNRISIFHESYHAF